MSRCIQPCILIHLMHRFLDICPLNCATTKKNNNICKTVFGNTTSLIIHRSHREHFIETFLVKSFLSENCWTLLSAKTHFYHIFFITPTPNKKSLTHCSLCGLSCRDINLSTLLVEHCASPIELFHAGI